MSFARRFLAPLLPCGAVLVGMIGLRDIWTTLLLYHAGMLLCLVTAGRREGLPPLGRGPWRIAVAAALVSATCGPLFVVLWPLLESRVGNLSMQLADLGLPGTRLLFFAAYYATVHPVLEEVYWRGWLGPATTRPHWNDLAFAAYHGLTLAFFIEAPWILPCVAVLAAAAWLWRLATLRWRGLLVPILSHAAADFAVIAAAVRLAGESP